MELDKVAIRLLRDFVKEKLGGNINKLFNYDLKLLADDRKYGENFFERSPIVKAMMSLAFGDVWPGLSMDSINKGKFECARINKDQNLFGINMCDQYFKGMQKFNPSSAQHQRALKVSHMSYSLGNLWVLPCSPSIASRVLDNSYRYYMDRFIISIYNVLTGKKRVDKTLQSIIENNKLMDVYEGEEGFDRFIKDMMLDDYLDYYRKPAELFPFVWSAMKDLDRESYFSAVDIYSTFCEKFIPKRAVKIIEKLNKALAEAEAVKEPLAPIVVTERPKTKATEQQGSNIMNRYSLVYQFITMAVEFAKDDINRRVTLLAEKEYYITLAEKMELQIEGFSWNDLTVSFEEIDDTYIAIFFVFPKPEKEPEALYGAVIFNRRWATLNYYTLEMCSHPGRWALGENTNEAHKLLGMYDIEPTKTKFLNLIIPPESKIPADFDTKALFNLPDNYKVLENMPEDPSCSVNYGLETPSCIALIQACPENIRKTMLFYDTESIIKGVHTSLDDNQALIEVKKGMIDQNKKYIYTIIKSKTEERRIKYSLIMHLKLGDVAITINGFFLERGLTGIRDSTVYEMATRKGIVSAGNNEKWCFDPYDKDFKHPFLMNLSEKEVYDMIFPNHPLAQCRQFVKLIIEKI